MKLACLLVSLLGYEQVPATIEYYGQPHHLYYREDHIVLAGDKSGCVVFQSYGVGSIKGDGFPWITIKPDVRD